MSDRRGHHKTDDEVDELERLRRENVRLKRQLEEKEMAGELLKKANDMVDVYSLILDILFVYLTRG